MPMKDICGKFINIEEGDKEYYHIYILMIIKKMKLKLLH